MSSTVHGDTAGARWGSACPWPLGGGLGDDGVEEHGRAGGGARFVDVVDGLRGGEMLHMKEAGKYLVEFGPGQVGVGSVDVMGGGLVGRE
jgi:hypothetical protein